MDTLEFLQTILPHEGNYYLVLFPADRPHKVHKSFSDLAAMAAAIDRLDGDPGFSAVYHACASYATPYIESDELNEWGKPKRVYRKEANWYRAQSFWVDIDCGQDKFDKGAGYLNKLDGAKAVAGFAKQVGIAQPMIVDSGNGVHAYWPLDRSISHVTWNKVAPILKATLAHCGVLADPTRTADFSSILRPVGSTNRKGGAAKPVVLKRGAKRSSPEEFANALVAFAKANGVKAQKAASNSMPALSGRPPAGVALNDDLTAHLPTYPKTESSGAEAATRCAQMAEMRDTQGDVSYDHWRGVIGVLKHCVDGEELAAAWTAQREATGHDSLNWRERYDTWSAGPTSCEFFEKCNPAGCEGCVHKGKVKGPVMLGRIIPISEAKIETVLNDDAEEVEVEVPALLFGYGWDGNMMVRWMPDKDNVPQAYPFSTTLFYPTARIRTEDGTYRINIRMHLHNRKVRDFEMPFEAMASNTDMLRCLAKFELLHSNHKDAGNHMAAYLRDQLEKLKRQVEEVNTLTTFGWKDDDTTFLLGDRLFLKDGTSRRVLVSGGAAKYASAFNRPKTANLKLYADAINTLYNHPGRQHWQYAIVSGWGSILAPFCEELYKGLVLALQGGDSGKGKTTVSYASLYAFGNASDMAMNSKDGFTYNALWAVLATFNNIPILLDELTKMDGQLFSDMAYGVSAGQEKIRMVSKGGQVGFAPTLRWRVSPFVTGNQDFHGLLAAAQANSQAEAVRLVQINVDQYPRTYLVEPDLDRDTLSREDREMLNSAESAIVQSAVEAMRANRGVAGEAMVQYVLQNPGIVADEVRRLVNDFVAVLPDSKYRFYRCHAACALTMARIARDLGIVAFDLDDLRTFTEELMTGLAEAVTANNTVTMEDAFSRMMASLTHRVIVTQEFRDKRHTSGPETPRNRIVGDIAGRFVLGSPNAKDRAGHIMLNQKDVRDWCMKNRTDYNKLIQQLDDDGALVSRSEKLTITRGTDLPTVQARCIVVDSYKLDRDALTLVSNNSNSAATDKAVGGV